MAFTSRRVLQLVVLNFNHPFRNYCSVTGRRVINSSCITSALFIKSSLNCQRKMSTVTDGEVQAKGKTAGIIIIGDEVLKGQVLDINSNFLCKQLYSLGIKLGRISIIPDELDDIAAEVRLFSSKYDFVFTTGGVGPTHDDITYAGVAQAFSEPVAINTEMAEMIEIWLGHKGYSREVIMKMAEMPTSAKLFFDPDLPKHSSFPIGIVRNVHIFPGIPQYLQKMFPRMIPILRSGSGNVEFHSRVIYVDRDEMSITPQLNEAVAKFHETVTFGSYPVIDNLYFSTRLTMESKSRDQAEEAQSFLSQHLPQGSLVEYDNQPLDTAADKVYAIFADKDHPLHQPVHTAVTKIEEALEKYSIQSLWICFNGGKDCTVLLHLFYAVIRKKLGVNNGLKIPALCISIEDPFIEMESFIQESAERYKLKLSTCKGPIHSGLGVAVSENPDMKAVLMGTRRSDPSGQNLDYFQMTDPSWPQIMRVSPMLDWTYENIWTFLRSHSLPYCPLYNQGYTSIGSKKNTVPNPSLKYTDPTGKEAYKAAYTLNDCSVERNGRK